MAENEQGYTPETSKELSSPEGVKGYMSGSTSEQDWNNRCDEVKAAHGGNYPDFWFNTVIMSGLASRVASKW